MNPRFVLALFSTTAWLALSCPAQAASPGVGFDHPPGSSLFMRVGDNRDQARRGPWEEHSRREKIKEELMALPPEERKEKMQALREEFSRDHQASQSEHKEKFEERWKNATPEQKEKFCSNVEHKCAEGGGEGYGCKVAQEACSSL